mmetsp:Transcript_111827/g.311198  ORF Transcript_111827/g.311198 Transcript_111827/m.311198 type:complete len:377 (+) Transcript_111827:62-1192(+)
MVGKSLPSSYTATSAAPPAGRFSKSLRKGTATIDLARPLRRGASFSHGKVVLPTRRKKGGQAGFQEDSAAGYGGPFPGFARPLAEEVQALHTALAAQYGERLQPARSPKPVLDVLVSCILSQNTTNTNSHAAMENIRAAFPMPGRKGVVDWERVWQAPATRLEKEIRVGGLARTKAACIRAVIQRARAEHGRASLEHLRKLGRTAVLAELAAMRGVGAKTASIVVMFALGMPDFAVDTHVFRYAKQLGWVPTAQEREKQHKSGAGSKWPQITRDSTYTHLNSIMPDSLKYSMHLILTDTRNGLPVDCPARRSLSFDANKGKIFVDGHELSTLRSAAQAQPQKPVARATAGRKRPYSTILEGIEPQTKKKKMKGPQK